MKIDIIIWHIMRIIFIPKILIYRILYGVKFPFGSIVYWFPKIRSGKNIKLWKGFQLGRLCRMNGNIKIGKNFFMNEFGTISAGNKDESMISIWDNVMIWPLFYIISQDHGFLAWNTFNTSYKWKKWAITIWNNVWIGARVTILKWVSIWDNVVIGAWSVVTKDIPSNTLAVWNPCQVKKEI